MCFMNSVLLALPWSNETFNYYPNLVCFPDTQHIQLLEFYSQISFLQAKGLCLLFIKDKSKSM